MGKIKSEKKARVHEQIKQGLVFNKDFGQHILKNPLVTTAIVEKVCLFFRRVVVDVVDVVDVDNNDRVVLLPFRYLMRNS